MKNKGEVFLSNATREVEYKLGYYNSIIAPVGSGKTTYAEGELLRELDNNKNIRDGFTLLLAPYTALVSQIISDKVYKPITKEHEDVMTGAALFSGYDARVSDKETIVMTPHKFFRMLYDAAPIQREMIMSSIRAIIIDEADHTFRLRYWEKDSEGNMKNGSENIFSLGISMLKEYRQDVLIIGITATGEFGLRELFHGVYNKITFKEELKRQYFSLEEEYSDLRLAYNRAAKGSSSKDKIAIYIERIESMKHYREYFENAGLKVAMITADNPDNYTPSSVEKDIKKELSDKKGISSTFHDKGFDILMFNAAFERGVSVKDRSFKSIIVHSSDRDTQTQSAGRFRFNGMKKYVLLDEINRIRPDRMNTTIDKKTGLVSSIITIPEQWLGTPLTSHDKKGLIEEIGYNKTWRGLKPELIKQGYTVKDTRRRIQGKSTRVSTITQQ